MGTARLAPRVRGHVCDGRPRRRPVPRRESRRAATARRAMRPTRRIGACCVRSSGPTRTSDSRASTPRWLSPGRSTSPPRTSSSWVHDELVDAPGPGAPSSTTRSSPCTSTSTNSRPSPPSSRPPVHAPTRPHASRTSRSSWATTMPSCWCGAGPRATPTVSRRCHPMAPTSTGGSRNCGPRDRSSGDSGELCRGHSSKTSNGTACSHPACSPAALAKPRRNASGSKSGSPRPSM